MSIQGIDSSTAKNVDPFEAKQPGDPGIKGPLSYAEEIATTTVSLVEQLYKKLDPILKPSEPEDPGSPMAEQDGVSDLFLQINHLNWRGNTVNMQIQQLLRRIDLP